MFYEDVIINYPASCVVCFVLFTLAACYVCVLAYFVHFGSLLCLCAYTLCCSLWLLAMFVCLYFGLLALGCLLLFEDAAVYFKKHCTNKHKRNLPSRVTTVTHKHRCFLPLQTNARGRQHEAQIPHKFTRKYPTDKYSSQYFPQAGAFVSGGAIYTSLEELWPRASIRQHTPAHRLHGLRSSVHGFILNPQPDVRDNSLFIS